MQIEWGYLLNIVAIHALSLLAFVPGIFSWWGLVLAFICHHLHGLLGITLCYHRILTHQGLVIPKPLEHFFALLGVCCLQDTPARWVAVHRLHHRHSDRQPDPHSPLVNFFWAHVGWVLVRSEADGPLALGPRGTRRLADGRVDGEDPLASFSPNAARHLLRTDGFLQGVAVPAGEHVVRLVYREAAIGRGLALSALVWLGLVAMLVVAIVRARRDQTPATTADGDGSARAVTGSAS